MYLSAECNWRLKNINKAFDHIMGKTAQSFFVYSDVMKSDIIGNQVTDLLREVKYHRTGAGVNYLQPLHIQYLPVRSNAIHTVTVEVSVKFEEGDTLFFEDIQTRCWRTKRRRNKRFLERHIE